MNIVTNHKSAMVFAAFALGCQVCMALPDRDSDGIPDDWEIHGYHGLNLPGYGCNPDRADLIVITTRHPSASIVRQNEMMAGAQAFYRNLNITNLDGSRGVNLIWVSAQLLSNAHAAAGLEWPAIRDLYLPPAWKGLAHHVYIGLGNWGQSNQPGDGGGLGDEAGWRTFVHEMGHQIGLSHEGAGFTIQSPLHASLMNYDYSYSFDGDPDRVQYSPGKFSSVNFRETDLNETLPFSIDDLGFLSNHPYRFRLQSAGPTSTYVDWNHNGVMGENHVRADINYAYSTQLGQRTPVALLAASAPVLAAHTDLLMVYGQAYFFSDPALVFKQMAPGGTWSAPKQIDPAAGQYGDPSATRFGGSVWVAYRRAREIVLLPIDKITNRGANNTFRINLSKRTVLSASATEYPTLITQGNNLYLFVWNAATRAITYRRVGSDSRVSSPLAISARSNTPVAGVYNTKTARMSLVLTENYGGLPNRLVVRNYRINSHNLTADGSEWVGGPYGADRTSERPSVVFDGGPDAPAAKGRLIIYHKGITDLPTDVAPCWVSMQVGDTSFNSGWLTRMIYDEWSTTAKAPAATLFNGDIAYAFRWAGDNDQWQLYTSMRGSGIETGSMGDTDEITYIKTHGLKDVLESIRGF